MSRSAPMFTAFTGTYNRGTLLPRVYESLRAQTTQDFEWIVIDDGSTDDTRERVESMISEAQFPIRYVYKENAGIHTAHNVAIQIAAGELFLRCDSDDEFVPAAMQTFAAVWRGIPPGERASYSGVSGLCMDEAGSVVGRRYPVDGWDSDWRTLSSLGGDKLEARRTSVLREFPFPVYKGEKFVPENLIWGRMHEKYRTYCINVALLRVHHIASQHSLTSQIPKLRYACGRGYSLYYREDLARPHTIWRQIKLAANYSRTCFGLRRGFARIVMDSPRKVWTLLTMPLALALYARDWARGLTRKPA